MRSITAVAATGLVTEAMATILPTPSRRPWGRAR
jgi:hypothetical protein